MSVRCSTPWSEGDEGALAKLTPIVYAELHRLARRYLKRERAGHSLQATELVNVAYTRLVDYKRMQWQNRAHFFAVSSQLIRRILVDHAHRHNLKRGGEVEHFSLDEAAAAGSGRAADLVALDDAMDALARQDPRKVQVIEMRFFGGLSVGRDGGGAESLADNRDARLEQRQGLALSGIGRREKERIPNGGSRLTAFCL